MLTKFKKFSVIFLVFLIIFIISIFVALHSYRNEIKRNIIAKISIKASEFLGHDVEIKDISFSSSEGVNFYNINIKNPPGFKPGNLLTIKKLHMNLSLNDLLAGRFFSENVTVTSPELIIYKDENGKLNLSDKLLSFFKREPKLKYKINEFKIESGSFKFYPGTGNQNLKLYRELLEVEKVNISLKDLSSNKGVKTLIDGKADYRGGELKLNGWAYLKDDPKKFMASASLDNLPLSDFNEISGKHGLKLEKAKINAEFFIEGSTEIINLKNSVQINNASSTYISSRINGILIKNKCRYIANKDFFSIDDLRIDSGDFLSVQAKGAIRDITKHPDYKTEITVNKLDLSALEFPDNYKITGILKNAIIKISGNSFTRIPEFNLKAGLKNISVSKEKKNLIQKASMEFNLNSDGENARFNVSTFIEKLLIKVSGTAKDIATPKRFVNLKTEVPDVKAIDIRDALWNIFPDNLLYAGMEGLISSVFSIDYSEGSLNISGTLKAHELTINGENGEFTVGPVNGEIPVNFQKNKSKTLLNKNLKMNLFSEIPAFEKDNFQNLKNFYKDRETCKICNKITIGNISYGMPLLKNLTVFIEQDKGIYNIPLFDADISGGRLKGTASVNVSNGLDYTAGFIIEKLSLREFCEGFEPIKGYISGLVDGLAFIKGSGSGLTNLIGKVDLWTYSSKKEKTKISKEFLKKAGGPSLKAYLGDRNFDKGIVTMYLKNGYIIFSELEISNRNILGIKDLSIKVAPFNNRISIDHLMWTITEAAHRAKSAEADKNK